MREICKSINQCGAVVVGGINGKSNPKYSPFALMHFGDILSTWEMHLDIVFTRKAHNEIGI